MLGMPPGLGYFTRRSSRTARKLVPPFCPAEKINFIVGNIIRVAHAVKRYYRPLTFILNVAGFIVVNGERDGVFRGFRWGFCHTGAADLPRTFDGHVFGFLDRLPNLAGEQTAIGCQQPKFGDRLSGGVHVAKGEVEAHGVGRGVLDRLHIDDSGVGYRRVVLGRRGSVRSRRDL